MSILVDRNGGQVIDVRRWNSVGDHAANVMEKLEKREEDAAVLNFLLRERNYLRVWN